MRLSEYTSQTRGAKSELARALNIPPQLLGQWANGIRPIPVARCAQIELVTKGAVSRRDLRPEDWALIWPELNKRARTSTRPAKEGRAE